MNFINTEIEDVKIIEPQVFGDTRGFFFESFNQKLFIEKTNQQVVFCQDNHSKSSKGVLRGLHFQRNPFAQGKLVRCISGAVFDVAVDIRLDSPTFGKYVSLILSAENKKQLWIPAGLAHGFLTLEDNTEFVYKTTEYYNPLSEGCIAWNDVQLNINWPQFTDVKLSDKDKLGITLEQYIEEIE